MGDRANVCVKENDKDNGVYLYTHWGGSELPQILQDALKKRWRWTDTPYLTRIIFDEITDGNHGKETGFGISSCVGDGDDRVLVVNVSKQTVSRNNVSFSFEKFCKLTPLQLEKFWYIFGKKQNNEENTK